ncbi:hypothetical protein NC651_035447 [Populus alba x Populus x berolinensis]|nr:hypothetical protein NC651_035447 [Populus alba x Populus x berolinensis]
MLELHSCLICSHSLHVRDLEFIVKSSEEHGSDIFRQILQAKCPSIYGHGLVKELWCLQILDTVVLVNLIKCLQNIRFFLTLTDF